MGNLRTWEAWKDVHQPFEREWWRKALAEGHSRDDAEFAEHWAPAREFIKPKGRVLDIGCGPRPPFVPCTVIEPLAIEYRSMTPREWWLNVMVVAAPAEEFQLPFVGEFDTIVCWNALDHTVGWRRILDNMLAYGSADARFAIATDFHKPFDGHPGYEREDFDAEIEKRFKVIEKREPFGRALAMLMVAK